MATRSIDPNDGCVWCGAVVTRWVADARDIMRFTAIPDGEQEHTDSCVLGRAREAAR